MTTNLSSEFLALQQALSGRFFIERELGRGGMGIVLLARDVALDRLVAIKLLPLEMARDTTARERFLREARTAAGLSHPNIVPIHSVEEHGDLVFFVMGYVEGTTLRERVEHDGPLSPRLALNLMQQVAWALAYAHQRGVIHRDIKPDNIMVETSTDRALVTDFGIALGRHDDARGGEAIGTARYMSPEQACGEPVDARSDLYSLGGTFFYALSGRPPFDGRTLPAILAQQVSEPTPSLAAAREGVAENVAAVIERCLEKNPDDRWPSGDEVARVVGEVRGRDYRAPPLIRGFLRNAQVTTMVILAVMLAGNTVIINAGTIQSLDLGPGLVGTVLLINLVRVARRLLREGYTFTDIRQALLAEARVQEEESEALGHKKWMRRFDTMWHKWWAGGLGRWFFSVAGVGIKKPEAPVIPAAGATEFVLGRSTMAAWEALPGGTRRQVKGVPDVVERLEKRAARLREEGHTGEDLNHTMAALENVRLAMLKLNAGLGSVEDLTLVLERARAIGDAVDRGLEARKEVGELLAMKPR